VVKEWCARFSSGSRPGSRHAGRRAGVKVQRPAGRTTLTLALLPAQAGGGPGTVLACGVRAPFEVNGTPGEAGQRSGEAGARTGA
jgi:hypothetical protein